MKPSYPRIITLAALIAAFLSTPSLRATIVFQDNFDSYAVGPLPTNNAATPWIGHSGNPVTGGSQVVADPTGASANALQVSQALAQDVHANLTNQPYSSAGTNALGAPVTAVYASFQIYVTTIPSVASGSQTYFAHFYQDTSTFKGRLFIITNGAAPGNFRIAIQNGGSAVTNNVPLDLSPNTPYTLVERFVLSSGVSTVWVNPTDESSGNSATAFDNPVLANITAYAFRQNAGEGVIDVDNLIVGTSFADVVPGSINAPIILAQPQDTNVFAGSAVVFRTLATGDPTITYQWYYNTNGLLADSGSMFGSTSNILTITGTDVGRSGTYSCVASNAAGTNVTRFANLLVSPAPIFPVITNQPTGSTNIVGDNVSFTVVAGGLPAPAYQWKTIVGNTTNNVSGANVSGTNSATLTFTGVTTNQAGLYFVTITNLVGSTNSAVVTLGVNPPPVVSIATFRNLVDPVTYLPTNTAALYTVQGIVTTWSDMTGSANVQFYMQDSTAGIAVFWSGASAGTNLPPAGALVRVTGPMSQFNGLLEIAPVFTNALHSVVVISTNNPLPAPQPLPFDPNITGSLATMKQLESSYFVASNVFLAAGANFAANSNEAITNNVRHVLANPVHGLNFTNEAGQTFAFFVNASTDVPGKAKPTGPVTIYGILGYFSAAGYQFTVSRYADIVSYTHTTNVLANVSRFGDQLTNNFTESVLRPGEILTTYVGVGDPEGGPVTLAASTDGLPADAYWTNVVSGLSATAQFVFRPSASDAGSNYLLALTSTTASAVTTNFWNVYVPTPVEQQLYISEVFVSPTTNATSKAYNPLQRAVDTNNVAVNDQYIELANLSGTDVSLEEGNGWFITDGASIVHQFFLTTSLASSNAVIVYGGPKNNDANPPSLAVPAKPSSQGALGLRSAGGVVTLHNGNGYLVDRVVYPAGGPAGSFSRFPTLNRELVPQAYISTNWVTPGFQYDGGPWNLATKVPAGITSSITKTGNVLQISFTADTALASTLWQADKLFDRFLVVNGRQFTNTAGSFSITNPPSAQQFYIITTQ